MCDKKLAKQITDLDAEARNLLIQEILNLELETEVSPLLARENVLNAIGIECVYCDSGNCVVFQKTERLRYKCRNCKRTFRITAGTPLQGLHKLDEWRRFIPMFLQSWTIRKAATELDLSVTTVFNWRHKLLSAFTGKMWINEASGIVEIDELAFDFCQKGSRNPIQAIENEQIAVVVCTDRYSQKTQFQVVQKGRIQAENLEKVLSINLVNTKPVVIPESNIEINSWLNKLEKSEGFSTTELLTKATQKCEILSSLIEQFETWQKRFYGVASKYLNNYLNWFNMLDSLKNKITKSANLLSVVLFSTKSRYNYESIKSKFDELMNLPNIKTS